MRKNVLVWLLVALIGAACAPAPTTSTPQLAVSTEIISLVTLTPDQSPTSVPTTTPAQSPIAAPAASPGDDATPTATPFVVSKRLHATRPSTVNLAAGKPQLVEFFAFW